MALRTSFRSLLAPPGATRGVVPPALALSAAAPAQAQRSQAKLAFYGIGTTCAQHRAGRMSKDEADVVLSGDEQWIADFLHELDNEMTVLASSAQVADLDKVRSAVMAKLMNRKVGGKQRFSVEPEVSDKPCRSLDE